jgi:hypothetical protein
MNEDSRDARREQLLWLMKNGFPEEARAGLDALRVQTDGDWANIVDLAPDLKHFEPADVDYAAGLHDRLAIAHLWRVDSDTGELTHIR